MTAPTNGLVTGGAELPGIAAGARFEAAFELRIARERS